MYRCAEIQPSVRTCEHVLQKFVLSAPLTHTQLARLLAPSAATAKAVYRHDDTLVALAVIVATPPQQQPPSKATVMHHHMHPPVYRVRQCGADVAVCTHAVELAFWAAASDNEDIDPRTVPGLLPFDAHVFVPFCVDSPILKRWPRMLRHVTISVYPNMTVARELGSTATTAYVPLAPVPLVDRDMCCLVPCLQTS